MKIIKVKCSHAEICNRKDDLCRHKKVHKKNEECGVICPLQLTAKCCEAGGK